MKTGLLSLGALSALLFAATASAQPPADPGMTAPSMGAAPPSQGYAPPPSRAFKPRGRFARMDQDRDGKVTLQEFVAFQDQTFDRIDAGHKGQITKADVDAFMTARQNEAAGRMLRGRGEHGEEGEKMLTALSDRLGATGVLTRQQWERRAAKRFERMDAQHRGYLTPEDFAAEKANRKAGDPTMPGASEPQN